MSELVKNLIKRFEYNRKHKKNYLLMLLVMAVLIAGTVTWGLKLTGVSVTAEDTEVADALETYELMQSASAEESTQESKSTELTQEENQQKQELMQPEDTQESTEVSAELTERTEGKAEEPFTLDTETVDGITVSVSGNSSSFPYPADELEVKANEVTDEEVVSLCDQLMEANGTQAEKQYFLSLSVYHGETEVEPDGTVTISFGGLDTENYEPSIYGIDTENEAAENMEAETDEDGNVAVETEQVSCYGIMLISPDTGGFHEINGKLTAENLNGKKCRLTGASYANDPIIITSDTTIDLNGNGIYFDGNTNNNCFWVKGKDAALTIMDSQKQNITPTEITSENTYGNKAAFEMNDDSSPKSLTYYVTESEASGTGTKERLYKYTVEKTGFITAKQSVACIVYVSDGATLNVEGGLLTSAGHTGHQSGNPVIINESTTNISGGYVCGGKNEIYHGGGIVNRGTLDIRGDGVIAANTAKNGGGIYCDSGTLHMSGGFVTGNTTTSELDKIAYHAGLGGGIYAINSTIEISGTAYITNNREEAYSGQGGWCNHGGGGVAALLGTTTMSGGYVTGNWSNEAGGGFFLGHYDYDDSSSADGTVFQMTGGTVAGNVAENAEGGGIRISGVDKMNYPNGHGAKATIDGTTQNKIYITNNITNSTFDWGGGGVFVQKNGELNIKNVLITANKAGGFGGGVGACPTGNTIISHKEGAAIYENQADGKHYSGGGDGKNYDKAIIENTDSKSDYGIFKSQGYQDYFCVRKKPDDLMSASVISLVTGKMLGEGEAQWSGSCDGEAITISKNGYAAAKYLFGLSAGKNISDTDKNNAFETATVVISNNSSYTHGGGIMTNGELIIGDTSDVDNAPDLSISGTKALYFDRTKQTSGLDYRFAIYDESDHKLNEVQAAENGIFMIVPDVSGKTLSAGTFHYYLKEVNDGRSGITYDTSQYKISVTVEKNSITILERTFNSYYVSDVTVSKLDKDKNKQKDLKESEDYTGTKNADGSYTLAFMGDTFTNYKYGYELPATGGTGTIRFTIGGLLMLAGSLWYGYSMKRRRERRAG